MSVNVSRVQNPADVQKKLHFCHTFGGSRGFQIHSKTKSPMMRSLVLFLFIPLTFNVLSAQTDQATTRQKAVEHLSPVDANLQKETAEVAFFAERLQLLRAAFEQKDLGKVVAYEAALLGSMRVEIAQMEAKAAAESARAQSRKQASSGQLTPAPDPANAPKRDLFAEATTPTEIRLEQMQYTLAAFERHAFDPAKPDEAARDFAKLADFQKIMEMELAELGSVGR
jgi:hypothetical protein